MHTDEKSNEMQEVDSPSELKKDSSDTTGILALSIIKINQINYNLFSYFLENNKKIIKDENQTTAESSEYTDQKAIVMPLW